MTSRLYIIGFILVLAAGALYVVFSDHLPPRTPLKIARIVSQLPVPKDAEVIAFDDQWNSLTGDGYTEIQLQLSAERFDTLTRSAQAKGYVPLSAHGNESEFVRTQIGPDSGDLYRLERSRHTESYELAVLDARTKRLVVRVLAQ